MIFLDKETGGKIRRYLDNNITWSFPNDAVVTATFRYVYFKENGISN